MSERTIYLAAREKHDAAERSDYLDQACGGDAELRRRIEALLNDEEAPQKSTGATPTTEYPSDEQPPTGPWLDSSLPRETADGRIGPYRLLRKLGEGGMGAVYLAEQETPVRRQVALKIIKPGMDSEQVVVRFGAERQALAMMDHPNIARVFDVGATNSGRPFFVMELVQGVPLTKHCDDNRLTPRERLELFVCVCQAIQHAHQKGIIHRDIKPSNVLVTVIDGKPIAKVIDFGVAKAIEQPLTEQTLYTALGQVIGTFEYMSPEQAEASAQGVDTRSDIYSLGVLLYELLTGTTPLGRGLRRRFALDELLRRIREEEPPRPSVRLNESKETLASIAAKRGMEPAKLTKSVRGELDWIVVKALEKDRTRRYETVNGFARDVQRYLADEPVEACPPSASYRLRKFARKNRKLLATAAAFLTLLVLGVLGLAIGLLAVRAEQRRTTDALDQVTAEQAKTETALAAETKAWQRTREALDTLTDEVMGELLGKQTVLTEKEKTFLRKVLGFHEEFAAERGETAEARAVAAAGHFRVAQVRSLLGEIAEAEAGYREAIRLYEKLAADFPDVSQYRYELAKTHNSRGIRLRSLNRVAEAETAYRQALMLLEKLAEDFPAVPVYRSDAAGSLNNLALVLAERGKAAEAESAYRRAIAEQEKLNADFPSAPLYRQALAGSRFNLGVLFARLGKKVEAESAYRQAAALREKLASEFPSENRYRPELAQSYYWLADLLDSLGRPAEAETGFRQAIALQEKLVGEFPSVPIYRQDLATSYSDLGILLAGRGKAEEAETAYRQTIVHWGKLAADMPNWLGPRRNLAGNHVNYGNLLRTRGQSPAALEHYGKAVSLLEAIRGQDAGAATTRLFRRNAYFGRAQTLDQLHRYAEAAPDWQRAAEWDDGRSRPAFRIQQALSLVRAGDHRAAVKMVEELVPSSPQAARAPLSAGQLYLAASIYALSASVAKADAKLHQQSAVRAVALLRQALAAGFFKDTKQIENLKRQNDFDSLRQRDDFKQLLADLEAGLRA